MRIETGTALRSTREALGLSQAKLSELCGISQHALSAIELDKSFADRSLLSRISEALADVGEVAKVVARKKRYQFHAYEPVPRDPERLARYISSHMNKDYVHLLNSLHSINQPKKHTALSLFAGCGGMSLGFTWASFELKGFLEVNEGLRAVYRSNFPAPLELGGDISCLSDEEIEAAAAMIGPIDVIIGGPPCQGFSLSGKRSVKDPRNTLFLDYLRFVDTCRPRVAVMENVRLLTSMRSPHGGYVRDEIRQQFSARGYRVALYDVNAKDYGIPQHRERVFFIAVRSDIAREPTFPSRTHGNRGSDLFTTRLPYRTFSDACSDLDFIESGERSQDPLHAAVAHPKHVIDWLWNVNEGFSAHDNEEPEKRPPSGYNTTYKRQVWLEPGATVQTTFGMISGCRNVHPIATRSLTVREAARLQSFPDQFEFGRALGIARTGIGNAVPPLLAYQIAKHISLNIL